MLTLAPGVRAAVDDCDYDYLMQWKWVLRRDWLGGSAAGLPDKRQATD